MLDIKNIFIYLILITYSCAIGAVNSHSNLIYPQIKHKNIHKNEKFNLRNPFQPEK